MAEKYTTSYSAKILYSDGRAEDTGVLLARECPIRLFLNAKIFTTLLPPHLNEKLAIGHLITEVLNLTYTGVQKGHSCSPHRYEGKTCSPDCRYKQTQRRRQNSRRCLSPRTRYLTPLIKKCLLCFLRLCLQF